MRPCLVEKEIELGGAGENRSWRKQAKSEGREKGVKGGGEFVSNGGKVAFCATGEGDNGCGSCVSSY